MAELRSLQIVGASGAIDNVHFQGNGRGLALVLPGFRGGWMTAAVYYPVLATSNTRRVTVCMRMRPPLCEQPAQSAPIKGKSSPASHLGHFKWPNSWLVAI